MEEFQARILLDRRFRLAEGPVWDERKQLLHFVDIKGCALYTLDPETGEYSGIDVSQNIGCFALREKGGGFIGRYNPKDGELLAKVTVPASQSSSCCFGGKDLQTLFITSASDGKENEEHAGIIFSVRLPWEGTVMNRFRG